jgi:hypothetical protein
MNFLRALVRTWNAFFRNEPPINPNEPIARFLTATRHFSPKNNLVKQGAFLPDPYSETSVARIRNLSEEEIWGYGERYVAAALTNGKIYGRADVPASAVTESNLTLFPDSPPPRHALIGGWPAEKDARKAMALELARRSTLKLRD